MHTYRGYTDDNHPESKTAKVKSHIIQGRLHTKDDVQHGIQKYWPIGNEIVMIEGISMKGK